MAVFIAFGAAGAGPAAPEGLAAVGGFAEAWGWVAAGGAGDGLGVDAPFAGFGPETADESGGGPTGDGGEEDADERFEPHRGGERWGGSAFEGGEVSGLGHEGVGVGWGVGLDGEEPAVAVGVGVDETGVGGDGVVDGGDGAGDWGVDVGGGLDGFDDGDGFFGGDFAADLGEFDVDDVAEFFLGVVGDADGGVSGAGEDPFVGSGEAGVGWGWHGDGLEKGRDEEEGLRWIQSEGGLR